MFVLQSLARQVGSGNQMQEHGGQQWARSAASSGEQEQQSGRRQSQQKQKGYDTCAGQSRSKGRQRRACRAAPSTPACLITVGGCGCSQLSLSSPPTTACLNSHFRRQKGHFCSVWLCSHLCMGKEEMAGWVGTNLMHASHAAAAPSPPCKAPWVLAPCAPGAQAWA